MPSRWRRLVALATNCGRRAAGSGLVVVASAHACKVENAHAAFVVFVVIRWFKHLACQQRRRAAAHELIAWAGSECPTAKAASAEAAAAASALSPTSAAASVQATAALAAVAAAVKAPGSHAADMPVGWKDRC